MTTLRTGIDLVNSARVASLIDNLGDSFVRHTWTSEEIAECGSDVDRLAARWAAKEAAIKALNAGLDEISPTDIWVRTKSDGAPELCFAGPAAAQAHRLGLTEWSVSLTHERGLCAAVVVALADEAIANRR